MNLKEELLVIIYRGQKVQQLLVMIVKCSIFCFSVP